MNGFEKELEQRVLSVIPHGELEGVEEGIENWRQVVEDAESHPMVTGAAPYVRFTGLAEKGKNLKALEVRGVDPEWENKVSNLPRYIGGDAWKNFRSGEQQIILGKGIAKSLGISIGDSVTIMIPQQGSAENMRSPKRVRVKVTGLLSIGGQIDHSLALIPLHDAQQYTKLGNMVSGIALRTSDVLDAQNIVRQVGNQVSVYVYLRSWKQKFGFLYRDIQMVRTIMYLVMVLVIGVACFNIVSTLMMAVKDRASEIAILRTMGATDGLIKRIFIWLGVFSGVFGSIVGSVFGVAVALNLTTILKGVEKATGHHFLSGDIYFIDFLPSQVEFFDVLVVSGTAIVLSLLATWYPANKASQMNPAEVLSSK